MPPSLRMAPVASETPITRQPSCWMMRAAHDPTLPKPWMTTVVSDGVIPRLGAASRKR